MRKTLLVLVGAIVLAGCSIGGGDTYQGVEAPNRGVTVQATGTAKVVPDGVIFNFAVTNLGESAESATDEVAKLADKAREVLDNADIDDKDIASQSISVNEEIKYNPDGSQESLGYRATQSFIVTIREEDEAGTIVQDVIAAVGDGIRVDGVTPTVLDNEDALDDAREDAVNNARTKAEDYADLLGIDLGEVQSVSEVSSPVLTRPVAIAESTMDSAGKEIQVDLGEQDITVTIEVRWSIKD
jgi:uncharacterized protein YggE